MQEFLKNKFKRVNETIWELPREFKQGMNVPARIIATENVLNSMDDRVVDQLTNAATLPGIIDYAMCMPDGHSGYGFPVGCVCAFDKEQGIISPGAIGFDINCGMRLITTNLTAKEAQPAIKQLVNQLFKNVPAGVSSRGAIKITPAELRAIMTEGAKWCVNNNLGWKKDIRNIEENGSIKSANPEKVSMQAIKRGKEQLGTLGSGNHYLEVQLATAKEIYNEKIAKKFGITGKDQIVIMVHCGSRGFGHQICSDYLKSSEKAMQKYGIKVPDRELASVPFNSKEGQDYFEAMACAANFAFANRQIITHNIRKTFADIFERSAEELEMNIVYDVAHNIAKIEKHETSSGKREVIIHRKGATRAFGPENKELNEEFQTTGQPVIVGGSMETGSWLLAGTKRAEELTFGSTLHGSGRTMSRTQAKQNINGQELQRKMEANGIYVKAVSMSGLAEEAGNAYKNINEVVEAVAKAGISTKVCALKPIGNVKG